MAPPKKNRKCSIDGCERKHAAHGLCLMHYKRVQRHGSAEYRWGGKVIGRACVHCDRPAVAREMCMRHYQMWHRHGDPLYADKKKNGGLTHGEHYRRGYKMVCPVAEYTRAQPATEKTEKGDALNKSLTQKNHGLRDGSKRSRRQWEHRKIAGAKPGQIVHHIDGDRLNNDRDNLHVFDTAKAHADAHRSLELIAYSLLSCGLVRFDRESGRYELIES